MGDAPLPTSCELCVFFGSADAICRRHAPAPGHEEFELVFWPRVGRQDRCGQGAALTNGEGPSVTMCQDCIHWLQPGGEPIRPDYRKGLPAEWWAESGYCTRTAPVPSSDEGRRGFWKTTHAEQGCGEGEGEGVRARE